jgi:hypothetical protein
VTAPAQQRWDYPGGRLRATRYPSGAVLVTQAPDWRGMNAHTLGFWKDLEPVRDRLLACDVPEAEVDALLAWLSTL